MEVRHEEHRLATILSADVVGYSSLMGEGEAGAHDAVLEHQVPEPERVEQRIGGHRRGP